MRIKIRALFASCALAGCALTAWSEPSEAVVKLLREAGATQYAGKADYGAGLSAMYLGFDAQGEPVVGVASRETKTYKRVDTLVAVTPGEAGYAIRSAVVSDMRTLPGKSKDYVQEALNDISGRTFETADATKGLVDAVSGATAQYRAIYVSYAVMASKVIDVLNAPPDWPREPLP